MRIFKDEYFRQVNKMLTHIHRGDIYEANFCQEFLCGGNRYRCFQNVPKFKSNLKSPVRYISKVERQVFIICFTRTVLEKKWKIKIVSQPIKGTAPRSSNCDEDKLLMARLQNDEKERAENVMIVDLVRNDLSKSALKGTVEVEELYKVYSFQQVHQNDING